MVCKHTFASPHTHKQTRAEAQLISRWQHTRLSAPQASARLWSSQCSCTVLCFFSQSLTGPSGRLHKGSVNGMASTGLIIAPFSAPIKACFLILCSLCWMSCILPPVLPQCVFCSLHEPQTRSSVWDECY